MSHRPAYPTARRPATCGDVLRLVREDGVATRAELARVTGLSRPAVAARVTELIAHGLLVEHADGPSTGGRPPARLAFDAAGGAILVANLGQSRGQLAVCDLAGTILRRTDADLPPGRLPEVALPALVQQWTDLLAGCGLPESAVRGVGIGAPDPADFALWDTGPLSERFGVPVLLDNEVNVAALGEHRVHHPDVADMLLVKVSTGIGAGLVSGGRIQRGAQGAAGELGHIPVANGPGVTCRCGNLDCVEAVAGGAALVALSSAPDLPTLVSRAQEGDAEAVLLVRDAGRRLGEVIAAAVNILNPAVVILGGDLTAAYEPLVAGVREVVYRRATALATRTLRIEPSRLGELAGLTGCAAMVLDHTLAPEAIDAALSSA
ncbi:ROK family transcriptional regulator [Actinomadura rupiterrae]|uniref:ROK family transcriptional regulator n=1 Tax=Actinomadura rupiterrae TaxID=559627 RepID=UPI0020A3E216|nr:ROK family transcriptional regulator [Actinomadura rupiterrae]MCP2335986.1 putative NBD/HSP70 family sugar kinase [Actinomadura rupiterrae]